MLVIVCVAAMVGVCAVCWRSLRAVETIGGASRRADDRWRRDQDSLIMRLLEQIGPVSPETLRTHSKERIIQSKLDAAIEGTAMQDEMAAQEPEIPIEDRYTSEDLAMRA